jgi:hypothetical protein
MNMKRFLSTKNKLTQFMLWGIVIGMSALLINATIAGKMSFAPIIILAIAIAMIIWVLLDTRYVIKTNFLLYRSGPVRGRIDISSIKKIKLHTGLFVPVSLKPALDTNGFIITYNQYDDLFVSPQNSSQFLEELKKINPNIEVNS